jgi:hypothetical protein
MRKSSPCRTIRGRANGYYSLCLVFAAAMMLSLGILIAGLTTEREDHVPAPKAVNARGHYGIPCVGTVLECGVASSPYAWDE